MYAGLFSIAAVLRRNVSVGKEWLGSWDCYPHVYFMFVGPPAEVRKTTTMKFSGVLLDMVPDLHPAPTILTQAVLMKRLMDAEDNSVYIFAKEFSDLVMKQAAREMYEFLTSIFDGDAKFESETISRGIEFANDPCINLFAATTPGWIADNMPEDVISGGFASRCIFVYEDAPRYKKLFFDDVVVPMDLAQQQLDLVEDLIHISKLKGKFKIEPDAKKFLEDWNRGMKIPQGTKIASYFARKPTHVIKLAMIIRVAYSDDLTLTIQDFKDALAILSATEERMIEVFGGVGKNPYTADMKSILKFVKDRGRVTKAEILIAFEASAEPLMLERLLVALLKTKQLYAYIEDDDVAVYINNKRDRVALLVAAVKKNDEEELKTQSQSPPPIPTKTIAEIEVEKEREEKIQKNIAIMASLDPKEKPPVRELTPQQVAALNEFKLNLDT